MEEISVRTTRQTELIDITDRVEKIVTASKVSDGVCYVYVPHTTAGVTINENADPDVLRDIQVTLSNLISNNGEYRHREGNSPAHIKATITGFGVTVFIERNRLVLGTWQGIYFCEYDGPRTRKVWIKILPG